MKALILVDLQNDFFPGGALAVKEGDRVLPAIKELLKKEWDVVVASKDWHPPNHGSFHTTHHKAPGDTVYLKKIKQLLWPVHCVQGSPGAELASGWDQNKVHKIVLKGTDPEIDSYSTFFDNAHQKSTGLHEYLQEHKIKKVYLAGLTTDYCVKNSALDALELGYETYVVEEACKGVNLHLQDSENALEEIKQRGGKVVKLRDVL